MTTVYIVCGSPGAGKTTYGKQLAAEKGAVFLDIDGSTERLVRLALRQSGRDPDDRDSSHFKQTFRTPIYEQLFDIARDNLSISSVVIAGPFTREIQDARWPEKLAGHLGASVEIHYVFCRPNVRRNRLLARANPRDKAKLDDWDSFLKYYGNEEAPQFEHVFIDSSDSEAI
jgi:predicted kinase